MLQNKILIFIVCNRTIGLVSKNKHEKTCMYVVSRFVLAMMLKLMLVVEMQVERWWEVNHQEQSVRVVSLG